MDEPAPLHLVAPPGVRRERLSSALDALPLRLHDSLEVFRTTAAGRSCDVVVDVEGGVDAGALLELCREIADRRLEWTVLVPEEAGDGELLFRPVSAAFPIQGGVLPAVLDEAGDRGPPFDLHRVLRLVARVRHDVNNPLTAGLAETQLLLMDLGEDGEVRESLETIQRQLHRIRRLIQRLGRLRVPSGDSGPPR